MRFVLGVIICSNGIAPESPCADAILLRSPMKFISALELNPHSTPYSNPACTLLKSPPTGPCSNY